MLALETREDLLPVSRSLKSVIEDVKKVQVLDRHGTPLTVTYQNQWNSFECVPLYEIPEFLQQAFIVAEDQRFLEHDGVDWLARFHALWQNVCSLHAIRGASTITEQVVRMIHRRPRILWSRWLEGIEAAHLEKESTKAEILEFYLNQVPYAANRRGVVQAARYYFDRDLDTLNRKEMIALSVLVRAPSYLDLYKNTKTILPPIRRLSDRLKSAGLLSEEEYHQVLNEDFHLAKPKPPVYAAHFVNYTSSSVPRSSNQRRVKVHTTLDGNIQSLSQNILDQHLDSLKNRRVTNGAVLIVDHVTGEVLAWVNGGSGDADVRGALIDAVTALRQPGSSLKPFLYAKALEYGWTPATLINDSPLMKPVGHGLHSYRNYSGSFYGPVTLREALGNSLNIPAVRTIQFVGIDGFLSDLRHLGFESLIQHPDYYGDGLALGNGEVRMLELVRAYTALANQGVSHSLRVLMNEQLPYESERIYSKEVASLIANILSDPEAKRLEFGDSDLLNFPIQTAVKTGTSSDYRDSWAIGFNYRYTAGVWMGNLDGSPMDGVTGSIGPAMVLRSVFAELNKFERTRPLYLSPELIKKDICYGAVKALDGDCQFRTEWFIEGTEPGNEEQVLQEKVIRLVRPTNGLQLAMDPRIPDDREAFEFYVEGIGKREIVEWEIDDTLKKRRGVGSYLWSLERGVHTLRVTVWRGQDKLFQTHKIRFIVK